MSMGIYIEDMKMPQQGEFKHVRIYDNGEVTVQVDTGKEVYEAVVAHAVSVPPHGRLIDADALIDDVRRNSESYFADDFAHEWVDKAPTIIQAEPCKEKGK